MSVIFIKFRTFNLKKEILEVIDSIRFDEMTSIQEKVKGIRVVKS